MTSGHWYGWWFVAIRQQAITWPSVDPDLCCHMASLKTQYFKICLTSDSEFITKEAFRSQGCSKLEVHVFLYPLNTTGAVLCVVNADDLVFRYQDISSQSTCHYPHECPVASGYHNTLRYAWLQTVSLLQRKLLGLKGVLNWKCMYFYTLWIQRVLCCVLWMLMTWYSGTRTSAAKALAITPMSVQSPVG